jgi:hypothetical protein
MAIGSLSLNTTVTTIGAAANDLLAASTIAPRIMEVHVNLGAATASTYGLGRSGNVPVQTSPVLLLAENPTDPAFKSGCAVAWTTAPTVPANFFRRVTLPAAIGSGIIWTFPRGLMLAAGAAMLLWNLATNSAATNVTWVADE